MIIYLFKSYLEFYLNICYVYSICRFTETWFIRFRARAQYFSGNKIFYQKRGRISLFRTNIIENVGDARIAVK